MDLKITSQLGVTCDTSILRDQGVVRSQLMPDDSYSSPILQSLMSKGFGPPAQYVGRLLPFRDLFSGFCFPQRRDRRACLWNQVLLIHKLPLVPMSTKLVDPGDIFGPVRNFCGQAYLSLVRVISSRQCHVVFLFFQLRN